MEGTPWDLRLVYTHIYTHIHLYIHVFIHIHICSYTFSSTLIYIHTHLVFHYVFCRVNRWTLHQWMCPLYSHLTISWVPRPSILSLFCGCSLLLPVVWPHDLPPSPPDGVGTYIGLGSLTSTLDETNFSRLCSSHYSSCRSIPMRYSIGKVPPLYCTLFPSWRALCIKYSRCRSTYLSIHYFIYFIASYS